MTAQSPSLTTFMLPVAAMLCSAFNVLAQSAEAGTLKYNYFIEQTAQAGPSSWAFALNTESLTSW
jgi:tellurite resistance protein TehA-like permease